MNGLCFILLGFLLLEIKGEDKECNIDEWVPDESDRGYWVLCVESDERVWFPRASSTTTTNWSPEDGDFESCDKNVGLLIPPHGVVLFYNLRADGTFDDHSWHAGCRVDTNATTPKLMANMWLWNSPPNLYFERISPPLMKKGEHHDDSLINNPEL